MLIRVRQGCQLVSKLTIRMLYRWARRGDVALLGMPRWGILPNRLVCFSCDSSKLWWRGSSETTNHSSHVTLPSCDKILSS
ncbi:unnamed protein product [Linum trigynum]|uniref:Uncharacterized protein n=1 Tax=Linum trigynum TaxID=586398 RepID=A0AAV2DYE3_9ROSI